MNFWKKFFEHDKHQRAGKFLQADPNLCTTISRYQGKFLHYSFFLSKKVKTNRDTPFRNQKNFEQKITINVLWYHQRIFQIDFGPLFQIFQFVLFIFNHRKFSKIVRDTRRTPTPPPPPQTCASMPIPIVATEIRKDLMTLLSEPLRIFFRAPRKYILTKISW